MAGGTMSVFNSNDAVNAKSAAGLIEHEVKNAKLEGVSSRFTQDSVMKYDYSPKAPSTFERSEAEAIVAFVANKGFNASVQAAALKQVKNLTPAERRNFQAMLQAFYKDTTFDFVKGTAESK
jgi:hypothetical protein